MGYVNYSEVVDKLLQVFEAHPNVKMAKFQPDFNLNVDRTFLYPLFWLSRKTINSLGDGQYKFDFQLIILDQLEKGEENYKEINNNLFKIAEECLVYIDANLFKIEPWTFDSVEVEYDAILSGWNISFSLDIFLDIDLCKTLIVIND